MFSTIVLLVCFLISVWAPIKVGAQSTDDQPKEVKGVTLKWLGNAGWENDLPRSKLRGIEGLSCERPRFSSPPNVFIVGPNPDLPGFPLEACGNDGFRIGDLVDAASCGE